MIEYQPKERERGKCERISSLERFPLNGFSGDIFALFNQCLNNFPIREFNRGATF